MIQVKIKKYKYFQSSTPDAWIYTLFLA